MKHWSFAIIIIILGLILYLAAHGTYVLFVNVFLLVIVLFACAVFLYLRSWWKGDFIK